jgi:hypothetical protein
MTEDEVRDLLSEPKNVRFTGFNQVLWYYDRTGTIPSVTFNTDGMRVTSWQEPESR